MSEALDFIKNFEDLLKANEEEQRKTDSLKSVKEALDKEVAELLLKKKKTEQEIQNKLSQCDKDITERRENAERNFEAERLRLAELSKQLEAQKTKQQEVEIKQRQKDSEQNERARKLDERGNSQDQREVSLDNVVLQNKKETERIASEDMRIKKEDERIRRENQIIAQEKSGNKTILDEARNQQERIRLRESNLNKKEEKVTRDEEKNTEDRKKIEEGWFKLSEANKRLGQERLIEAKRKKDNDDKEAALRAMQIEIDFKIAQFKRKYEKDNK